MKRRTSLGVIAFATFLLVFLSLRVQYKTLELNLRSHRFGESSQWRSPLDGLPRGILQSTSDLEMKPLWGSSGINSSRRNYTALLAIAVGISQKQNVDGIVRKFLLANCSIILFHYDGNADGWADLDWSSRAIHVLSRNQTKWWFAKRFLHPDVVSFYDYIFLWDEDLGVKYFDPERYLQIMSSEGLDISQPALNPDLFSRITIRMGKKMVRRRVNIIRGSMNCSDESKGPPCSGWFEGMAPVFSQDAWQCAWHLIQNDLIHGWGLDMNLGYCAQGERVKKVGVIDGEFIIQKRLPSLVRLSVNKQTKRTRKRSLYLRSQIRKQNLRRYGTRLLRKTLKDPG